MFLRRPRRESDEVVHDDVNRATNGVGAQVSEIERFRPNALACKRRVAMHDDGYNFVQRFPRTINVRSAQAVTRLLRAGAANGNRIDGLQMAGIRNQVDADLFATSGDVSAGSADVVFHVARTQDAARIDVFKS